MWLIFWSYYLIARTCHSLTSELATLIHWLIYHAIQVIFVLFTSFLVVLDRRRSVFSGWLYFFYNLLIFWFIKIIHNHWFLNSLSFDSFHFLCWNRFSYDSLFCVNCNKIFVFNFIKMVSLTQINIFRDVCVSFLHDNKFTICYVS